MTVLCHYGIDGILVPITFQALMKAKLFFATLFAAPLIAGAVTINFEDLALAADSSYNGSDNAGGFVSGSVSFSNNFTDWGGGYSSWDGFGYSNKGYAKPATAGDYTYEFNTVASDNSTYAVVYGSAFSSAPTITLNSETSTPLSIDIVNTTVTWSSLSYGDGFAKQFEAGDWFKLTISAFDAVGDFIASIETFLADFTDGKSYIMDEWTTVDLSSLGMNVASLEFSFSSTDNGMFGINTPTYVAIDNLVAVPEPSTYAAITGLAVLGLAWQRRRKATQA